MDTATPVPAVPSEAGPWGPKDSWPGPLRTAVDLAEGSRFPLLVAWGDDLAVALNDAYAALLGPRGPAARGRPLREAWPEAWDEFEPYVARAMAGEATWAEDLPVSVCRHGYPERAWLTFSYSPIRDESGSVRGLFCALTETTSRVEASRLARFRVGLEERLRDLHDPSDAAFLGAEALGRHLAAARCGYGEVDDDGWTVATERDWTRDDLVGSLAGEPRMLEAMGHAAVSDLRAGRPFLVGDVRANPDSPRFPGREGAFRARLAVPVLRDLRLRAVMTVHSDEPRRWSEADAEVAVDVANRLWEAIERMRSDAALREGEERLRLALEAGRLGAWDIDLRRNVRILSERSAQIHGVPAERLTERASWLAHVHPDDRAAATSAFDSLVAGGEPYDIEYRAVADDGSVRWVSSKAIAQAGPDGAARRVIGVHADVTAAKMEERQRRLLIDELNHRVKNTLATVQSIASQTLRSNQPPAEVKKAFEGRLMALSRAHDILTRESWDGASLRDVVAACVEAHGGADGGRIGIDGPDLRLAPRVALALALCLQELATNATRHGSLSAPGGRVDVTWGLVPGDGPRRFVLRWEESGGAPVEPPSRRGFGTKLIERSLAHEFGEDARLEFAPGGVVCVIAGRPGG